MSYEVRVIDVVARPTVVARATTTWSEFPSVWTGLLDDVWACVRAAGVESGCPNVMLYVDDVPNVEVGVELAAPIALSGRVIASYLPAGSVATTVHFSSYGGLRSAHEAVAAWCAANHLQVSRTRWEVYGPNNDNASQVWTEVSWLLS